MGSHHLGETAGLERLGQKVVAFGGRALAVDLTGGGHLGDRGEAGEVVAFSEPGDIVDDDRAPGLDAAVIAVDRLADVGDRGRGIVQPQAHVLEQRRLIAFQSQTVIAATVQNGLRGGVLAVHRVGGDDVPLEGEQRQQLGQGRDLVAVAGDLLLPQHQALLDGRR